MPGTAEAVDAAMNALIRRLIPDVQRYLDKLEGRSFPKEESIQLSKALSKLARRLQCGYLCPHCADVARSIRFAGHRGAIWYWRYEHSEKVKHGGSTTVGPLKLVLRNTR